MIVTKEVELTWMPNNREYYIEKGYEFSKHRDKFIIKIEDLNPNSNIIVEVKCDYCDKKYNKKYMNYYKQNILGQIKTDCCEDCLQIKANDGIKKKYNVDHVSKIEGLSEKRKKTNLNIYGVDNPMKNEQVKHKAQTTMKERYGVSWYSESQEFKFKTKETFMKKYGVSNPTLDSSIREKQILSLYLNGTAPSSRQQVYLHKLYGGEINFPFLNYMLDIAFPNEKIYIEYDGGGHELSKKLNNMSESEYNKNERKRWYSLYRKDWKEIRIISSKDKIPSDEKLLEMLEYAREYLNTGRHFIKFLLDENKVLTSKFEKPYEYGDLRYISKELIKSL